MTDRAHAFSPEERHSQLEALLQRLGSTHALVREAAIEEARKLRVEDLWWLANREEALWRTQREPVTWLKVGRRFFTYLLTHLTWPFHNPDEAFVSLNPRRSQHSLAQVVAESDDPRLLGLALTLRHRNRLDYLIAGCTLTAIKRLLPKLSAEQRNALSENQGKVLLHLLTPNDVELTLAILKALEQIGGEGAIPYVERLLGNPLFTPLSVTHRTPGDIDRSLTNPVHPVSNEQRVALWIAASRCLKRLKQNAEQTKQASSLLRASAMPLTPEQLLRPVDNPTDNPPSDQLLRPPSL